MWRNAQKLILFYKELLPELKMSASISSAASFDLDAVVGQLYDKYFRENVQNYKKEPKDDAEQFRQLLNQHSNQADITSPTPDDVWIFGYGSLVWKADFPYIDRRRGYICGYQRRFYQHSIDHRGTEERPGRVVTLLPTEEHADRVYGMAYRIAAHQKSNVLQHLDYREKNGYERCQVEFREFPESIGSRFDIIMYIASHNNDSYAGKVWQLPSIADQIFTSAGPSGPNREYLFNLAHAMRTLFPGVHDEHLFELEELVLKRINDIEQPLLERVLKKDIADILSKDEEPAEANDSNTTDETKTVKEIYLLQSCCDLPGWREALLIRELQLRHQAQSTPIS